MQAMQPMYMYLGGNRFTRRLDKTAAITWGQGYKNILAYIVS
jgi:hypothetical protein